SEHAARGRGGDQFRNDVRAFLVPQRAQHGARGGGHPRARRGRYPRPAFLRLAAGFARHPVGRPGADREPRQKLAELVERGPHHARHGMARAVPRGPDQARSVSAGSRQRPQARIADHGARRELPQGGEPDRAALQRQAPWQGCAAHSHPVGKPGGARHDQDVGRCGVGSELRIGYGYPQISEMQAKRIPLGISVDTSALVGSSNLFAVLKLARDCENAKAESEFKMTARKALELGTIEGARSMGLGDQIGSLAPGKRADLIAISPNALNMAVVTDPAHLVLEATGPENVDTVVVDGRILKRGGKLAALDTSKVVAGARAALAGVRERTKWR